MTTPQPEPRPGPGDRGTYALTVTQAQAAAGTVLANGPKRLMGWSIVSGASATLENEGRVVAPAAGATITSVTAVIAGDYQVQWTVGLDGAAAAAELNNFRLFNDAATVLTSDNLAVANEYPQELTIITVAAGGVVSVKAIGAGTAGVGYSAQLTLTLLAGGAIGNVLDGAQIVGVVSTGQDQTDVQWMGDDGIYIGTSVAVSVLAGKLSGCLYVRDCRDGGSRPG